ncbi:MAG TPA: hypothetical protein VF444_08510 [Pseudonocardiaceae bacterium]
MAFRKIDVDDDVFDFLVRNARPFEEPTPNDVLRRVLLHSPTSGASAQTTGALKPLIDAGKLRPGDKLVHHQPRNRRTFEARVTSDGFIELPDGRRFAKPSPALKEFVGHQINGWDHWVVDRTGRTLTALKEDNGDA